MKKTALVLAVFFLIFFALQASVRGFWSWDDPYYHARHSALISERGNLTLVEPWLTLHFFNFAPTDPWWGYHLTMAGFVRFFGPMWGSKILSALLAALTFAVFYFILSAYRVRRPWLWTIIFFASSSALLSRLLLERPHLLTAPALMLAWWLARRRKYWWLFVLAFVYTLAYEMAPFVLIIVMAQFVADYWFGPAEARVGKRRADGKLLIAAGGGILAGIILHPQSLNYIYVMLVVVWQVLFLSFRGIDLGIGNEVVSAPWWQFFGQNALPLLFYLVAVSGALAFRDKKLYGLGLASAIWLVVALAVPRGADYFLPLAWLFAALAFYDISQTPDWPKLKIWLEKFVFTKITRPFLCVGLGLILANNIWQLTLAINKENANPFPGQLAAAAEWLKNNTPAGSVVFYDNWSYWPLMFYYNQHNRYLAGMDPTFSYEYNQELFWLWRNISVNGYVCGRVDSCPDEPPGLGIARLANVVANQFQSQYLLIKNEPHSPLYRVLSTRRQEFVRVFNNDGFLIYRLITPASPARQSRSAE